RVPSDVQPLCNVPKEVFEGWFGFSAVTPNGLIASPNNIIFDDDPKPPPATVACEHYQFYWSSIHMFLWLTSPTVSGSGTRTSLFDSSIFYQVGAPDSAGKRMLLQNDPDDPRRLKHASVTINQNGPHGRPVFFDTNGKMHSVVRLDITSSRKRHNTGAT